MSLPSIYSRKFHRLNRLQIGSRKKQSAQYRQRAGSLRHCRPFLCIIAGVLCQMLNNVCGRAQYEWMFAGGIAARLENESRAGLVPPARTKCDEKSHCRGNPVWLPRAGTRACPYLNSIDVSLGLAHPATVLFRRFLIVRRALHVPDQAFLLAQLLEASDHLLYRFTCPRLHFQHKKNTPFALLTSGSYHKKHSNY